MATLSSKSLPPPSFSAAGSSNQGGGNGGQNFYMAQEEQQANPFGMGTPTYYPSLGLEDVPFFTPLFGLSSESNLHKLKTAIAQAMYQAVALAPPDQLAN